MTSARKGPYFCSLHRSAGAGAQSHARAVRALRAATAAAPERRVVSLSPQMVGLRFTAAAAAAGLERRVTAHSSHRCDQPGVGEFSMTAWNAPLEVDSFGWKD